MGDGGIYIGKWVCGLERVTHHKNCRQSSSEQEVLRQGNDCQVYGFDFSVTQWGPELCADTEVSPREHFFPYKIGAADNHNVKPKHFIDIWKIDIEGSEFAALKAMQIEIHLNFAPDCGQFDKWWTLLEDAGLRPFWTELNLLDVNVIRRGPFVGELTNGFLPAVVLHQPWRQALLDDSLPDYP
ncbi:hypothetical protein B0H14DRAFT_2843998 [Mycena olivaceomarginata]|nr:hypothetical protein B0H14DRAFT_2843998 [Mycena olivaceomarginata]